MASAEAELNEEQHTDDQIVKDEAAHSDDQIGHDGGSEAAGAEVAVESQEEGEEEEEDGEEEEEEGECGFCLFMKSGPCRDAFVNWEVCVEGAEKGKEDIVSKCQQVTVLLKTCMETNPDYYEPVLKAERELTDAALEDAAASKDREAPSEEPLTDNKGDSHVKSSKSQEGIQEMGSSDHQSHESLSQQQGADDASLPSQEG